MQKNNLGMDMTACIAEIYANQADFKGGEQGRKAEPIEFARESVISVVLDEKIINKSTRRDNQVGQKVNPHGLRVGIIKD